MSASGTGAPGQPSVGHDRQELLLPITLAFVLLPLAVVLLRGVFVGFGWVSMLYLMFASLPHAACGAAVAVPLWRLPRVNPEHEPTTRLLADLLGTSDDLLAYWLSPPLLLASAVCGIAAMVHCRRRINH